MNHPFKVGDVVYHSHHGKMTVERVDYRDSLGYCITAVGQPHACYHPNTLSFKPWPKPCHERPIEEGWWVVQLNGSGFAVRKFHQGKLYYNNHERLIGVGIPIEEYKFIKFIGELPE